MARESISENIKRRLYAESMGRCMNPNCKRELFNNSGDISEKAHIIPYCETADNSFENLIILCPNCHTEFDKNHSYSIEEVRSWKKIREEEFNKLFNKKFTTFNDLEEAVTPLLENNKVIYEQYYLGNKKELWDKCEDIILRNNKELKTLIENNLDLIQNYSKEKTYSNLEYVHLFIAHINEFEITRLDKEKVRKILFPKEINSMFGIAPVRENLLPSTESLETLIKKLEEQGKFDFIIIGVDEPYIQVRENGKINKIFLKDTPRLRQLYFDYKIFYRAKVRLESLNYIYKYMRSRKIDFKFEYVDNLREIIAYDIKIVFVCEYCLSIMDLKMLSPEENSVIVNLHRWNGERCISKEAFEFAKKINVTLLMVDDFYEYINKIKVKK